VLTPSEKLPPLPMLLVAVVVVWLQLSVPTGSVYVTDAVHSPLDVLARCAGGHEITGTCRSRTTTLNVHELTSPFTSAVSYRTVVVPTGNTLPLANPLVMLRLWMPQLSLAVTAG
jgi:hypothetical protein